MIINSITLDNFKSHKHSVINLNKGISVILGENGAGKSSIFEAISYSFFKTYTGKIEDLLRKPANENENVNEMKVTIDFEHDFNHYKLIRGKKKKNNAKLYLKENNDLRTICEGDTLVTKEIETLLDLDSKSFLNAVYIRQGEITDLIEKTAAEKKELIAKLLNLDSLQKASDDIKSVIDIYNEQINENNVTLRGKNDIEESIDKLNKEIDDKKDELENISHVIEKLDNELDTLEKEVLKSDNDKKEYEALNNQIEQQTRLVNTVKDNKQKVESRLKDIEECIEKSLKIKEYTITLPKLEELKDYETTLTKHKDEQKNLNKTLDNINKNTTTVEETKENYDKYETIKSENDNLEKERSELESEAMKYTEVNNRLKDLNTRNESHIDYIRDTSDVTSKLFGENFSSPKEIEKKVNEEKEIVNDKIQKLTDNINGNDNNLSVMKNDLTNTKKSLKELENTKDTCPICQSTISHDKHLELSKEYNQKIIEYNNEIDKLNKDNEKQKKEREEYKQYLEKIESINIIKLNDEYQEFEKILTEIKECKESLPPLEEKNALFKELKEKIVENKDLLKKIEKDYNDHIVASRILNELPNINEVQNELDELDSKIQEIKGKCTEIIIKYRVKDDLDSSIKYARTQVDTYHKYQGIIKDKDSVIKEKEEVVNNLSEEEDTLKNLEEQLKNLNYDEEENKTIHESFTSQQNKLEENKLRKNTIETEIKSDQQQLDDKNKELKKLDELSEEQENLKKYEEILEYIRHIYGKDGVQKDLRNQAKPDIEKHTMDFFNEFDFDYTSLELDENYEIKIENKNEKLDLKMMSGGEKIVIALALRLGIASTISKNRTDLLILDEPTIHLDAERRSRLIDIIRQMSIIPQMIVVSHDDEMEALSNNIVKIVKENGISYVDNS